MKLKLKSDKGFSEFLRSVKLPSVIIPLCIGLLLIAFSGMLGGIKATEAKEDSLAALCSTVSGVGRCYTETSCDTDGRVVAVAIVCEGADNTEVRAALFKLIGSFYGIGYNRISILKISE